MTHKILIIDDEADIREVLADIFQDEGYTVFKAAHSEQAFSYVKKEKPDLIVLDIWLENSDMDGMEILKELNKNKENSCPVLMISGHGNIEMAVKAMKLGAYDFIEKPFKIDHMLLTVERALEQNLLRRENAELKNKTGQFSSSYKTQSPVMLSLLKAAGEIAGTDSRIMVLGERGTGKSKLASYIHQNSQRSAMNLTAYLAYELSATDINDIFADESLQQGTVLIEQVQSLDKAAQVALLAILNKPASGTKTPRLITTALSNIQNMVKDGSFSSALYNRLAVTQFTLPSLDQRLEDFPDFIESFSKTICNELNISPPSFSSDAIIAIQNHNWVGNIRQLKAAIEWLIICHSQMVMEDTLPPVTARDLGFILKKNNQNIANNNASPETDNEPVNAPAFEYGDWLDMPLRDARDAFEKKYLGMLLQRFNGNISQMATHIDMERTALHRKLKSMELRYEDIAHHEKPKPFFPSEMANASGQKG